jgi:hypothetical protein
MKFFFKTVLPSMAMIASASAQQLVPLSFNSIGIETGSSTLYSSAGDVWRATNVSSDYAGQMDALFRITGTIGVSSPSNVYFSTAAARGDNMRVIVANVTNAQVFVNVQLVNSGTTTPFSGWSTGDQLITQFSDLDSDLNANRTDFAGVQQGTYLFDSSSDTVNPGSSLLELNTTAISGYDVFRLKQPWTSQDNVIATDPVSQSPVTGAFVFNANSSLNLVLGQFSVGSTATRHIDIDMTPDFTIIPEPSSALLVGMAAISFAVRRRRK